jgi:hypothetical protein
MATYAELLRNSPEYGQGDMGMFSPESGQVKLQQFNPQNMSVEKTTDYTIPQDQIRNFNPSLDEAGNYIGGGTYVLNDGSQMFVGADGTVTGATPARNEYTLNDQGYYQPTGSGLTWDGNSNTLTKKIGDTNVMVSPYYQKGGYQDEQGNMRLDENGVPIALAPNFIDSGYGKSGMQDAAPYIAAALALAATGMPTGFEGMVAPSETLMGSLGASSGGFGLNAAGTGNTFGSLTAPSAGYTYGGLSASQVPTLTSGLTLSGAGAGGLTAMQKAQLIRSGANALGQAFTGGQNTTGGGGGGSAGGYNYANMPFLANPQQNQTYMKTGADVSGTGTTTTGMPVQLDTTRHNLLMANLLRG